MTAAEHIAEEPAMTAAEHIARISESRRALRSLIAARVAEVREAVDFEGFFVFASAERLSARLDEIVPEHLRGLARYVAVGMPVGLAPRIAAHGRVEQIDFDLFGWPASIPIEFFDGPVEQAREMLDAVTGPMRAELDSLGGF